MVMTPESRVAAFCVLRGKELLSASCVIYFNVSYDSLKIAVSDGVILGYVVYSVHFRIIDSANGMASYIVVANFVPICRFEC